MMMAFLKKLFGLKEFRKVQSLDDIEQLRRVSVALMTLVNEVSEALRRRMDYKLVITRLLLRMVPVVFRLDEKNDEPK
jgi:hypothetical protein